MVNAGIHTPAELARRAKVHRQAIHKYLTGEATNITADRLFKLAEALKVNPKWLALGPPESPVPPHILDPEQEELVQIKDALADNQVALDQWISSGRGLVQIVAPKSVANPFPGKKVRPK